MPSAGRTTQIPRLRSAEQPPEAPRYERPDRALAWKHGLDRVGAAVLLVLAAPLLALAALVVKLSSPGPVLARERRISRDGGSFEMFTFRSTPRLRRWAIDQLPQLFNVLRGDMSFVGPRPERPEFVELFGENLVRHDRPRRVRPGLTGWAQVRGLDGRAPLAERVRWDDWYVENWSLWLDVKIVLMTVRDVCRGAHLASAD
jgi:lipopolysaccharide/colanic/teichoic acid biosynthesis glycosyltransferase